MLSVVIPALNEEDGIADIIQRVWAVGPSLEDVGVRNLEIIVVDDGSQDRTAEIAAGFPFVRLLRHPVNRGYGAAIKTGFCHARGDLLAFLDADGTYPPERFPTLCQAALDQAADLVVGSRRSGAGSDMPPLRRLGNCLWSNLISLMGNRRVIDPASGMRVLRRSILPRLYPLPDGLSFTPVMSTRALHEGLSVAEVPIPYHERVGRSKLSLVHDGTRFLKTIIWTALEYNPVRVLGLVGLVALGIAGLIGLALVALRLQGVTHLGPWGVFSVFSGLVLGVAGVSIFSLGATFNYLVALFHSQPVQQGLLGRPILQPRSGQVFDPSLDRHFGWLGTLTALGGTGLAGVSLALGLRGWEIARLWLWLLGSALLILVGLQLVISWILMRVLEALSERELRIDREMGRQGDGVMG
jgi:glycosyltransferase involved in cell wall biosynthesis